MSESILVLGGGFSGLTAAVEAAEMGYEVYLVESQSYLGGRVAQLNKYFPKICPPTCGLEINFKRIKTSPRITFYTLAEVESVAGGPGNFDVTVKVNPRYTTPQCTSCSQGEEAATSEVSNDFNFGLNTRKPIYKPHPMAFPNQCVLDASILGTEEAEKIKAAMPAGHVNLDQKAETVKLNVGAIIVATGWKPYDPDKLENLEPGQHQNVVTNMKVERMASPSGPTGGKIVRPSDNEEPETVGFIQCAGSRDENHLGFCSYICCMATLKQIKYLREQSPDTEIYVFYIDIRSPGRKYEKFYSSVKEDAKVHFIKGKVAALQQGSKPDSVVLVAEDTIGGGRIEQEVDLAVLATGMQPAGAENQVSGIQYDSDGFVVPTDGIIPCGCAKRPVDVVSSAQSATAAALKAIQTIRRAK
ncbi:MAG TPA: CoB--CoM heterodisulfide reductase iron-sulfur subunit A family protein [Thermodesulfobacteriaceae bacterium]|nr:CoB--CoM heterodisulfide reductase iron-sulfur subunit A family protein [Thermodesulfobacteriaceae bacterium]